jgi:pseudouridine-5'-phosphate glycosidase
LEAESALVLRAASPAVALETALLTTGLPGRLRGEAVDRISAAVRAQQVEPAFVGVLAGKPIVGLTPQELEFLARQETKLSTRDLPVALARKVHGGTTVAATLFLAHRAGLAVASTGGIGGVHPTAGPPDVSADLYELARTPIILVCSGAKAMMDLPATLERLETLGVLVAGFGTDQFPAFWSAESGLPLDLRVDSPVELVEIWRAARALGTPGALLVCVPPPRETALAKEDADAAVSRALADLAAERITGPAVTPFLLDRVAEVTEGRSLRANLALLENNAALAASIARAMAAPEAEG